MERFFLECTIRAALVVGGVAMVLRIMRIKAAAARHCVWAGVVVLMLVLPIWIAWGPKASLDVLPALPQITANDKIVRVGTLPTSFLQSPPVSTWQGVLVGIYLLGLCLLLVRLVTGTVRARRLAREAMLHKGVRSSPLCTAPVTVGFFHPVVIFPEHWRQWTQAQLDAILTHEGEHARRRDSLLQWLALLNRALFWFHPAAWWLERNLSALAEEACDNVVLSKGHNPQEYAECLLDIAHSVTRSGARLNFTGMAMPGSFLPQRIRKIMEGGQTPRISRARMACVVVACAITCTTLAAGTLDRARQNSSANHAITQPDTAASTHLATKFVLGDLEIEGDVHDRDGVRNRILKAWKDHEYDDTKELADAVLDVGIRGDFQERGYFKVLVHDPVSRPLGLSDGKQRILIITSITEGAQFRLGTLAIQNAAPERALSIPAAVLRDQFRLRDGDLFNVNEIRSGLERLNSLYGSRGYADVKVEPDSEPDDASHRIDLIVRITERPHQP